MSAASDINKITDECKPFLRQANDVQIETHKTLFDCKGKKERRCHYELIYCFYDGIKNNFYHLLVRVCKCGNYKDLTVWLDDARKGYKDITDIQEGIELHINKDNCERGCSFEETMNPGDVEENSYLLQKHFCECPKSVRSQLR